MKSHVMESAEINSTTSIPLGWLVAVAVFLATTGSGAVYAYAMMAAKVENHERALVEAKDERKMIVKTLGRLERGSARMQEHMGIDPEQENE